MLSAVSFVLDGKIVSIDFDSSLNPTTTVLNFLRQLPTHKGVKEGCAEGDCGACTVVLGDVADNGSMRYRSVDSCLLFLPMIHGKHLITVENLKAPEEDLHPVQDAMVESNGSQCGYCTPGIVMAMFALYKTRNHPSRAEIDDALTGNLCRCTGYKPIVEAASNSCVANGVDHFTGREPQVVQMLKSIPQHSLHLKTESQHYFRPVTLQEALSLKHQHPEAVVLCGATDVALRVTKKHEVLKEVIDLSGIEELRQATEQGDSLTLGAALPLSDVMMKVKADFPALHDMLAVFGSQQIRNLATLGGNLGTASPIGDTLPVMMVYNARVVLESVGGKRELPIGDFFTGYRQTERRADELITAVIVPKVPQGTTVKAYKISKRKDLDISTLSGAFRLQLNRNSYVQTIRVVYGGMADRVKRARATEQSIIGKKWDRETIEKAKSVLDTEFTPISDARSGAEFRRVAARNLLMKLWSETSQRENGGVD